MKPQPVETVAAPSVPAGLRVLVVDDNYINRLLVIHLLQSRGFDVVEAASGYEALFETLLANSEQAAGQAQMAALGS